MSLTPALTPQDVARLLRVSPETVNDWAENKKLKGFKTPGGRWRFHPADIAEFLPPESQEQTA